MADGIKSGVGKVKDAVSGIANKIKGLLGFSEPEEGPLSNFHTYMPDMIELMRKGIRENISKVTGEVENIATGISYTLNTPNIEPVSLNYDTTGVLAPENLLQSILLNNDKDINLTIPLSVYVGNEKLGDILLEDLRSKKRQTGKNIEALVG